MSTNRAAIGKTLSLESIVAFNDELEALVRAGIPLERGLMAAAADYRGRLGRAIEVVAGRLAAGEPLPDAVALATQEMPDVYRAVIAAGVRSGRLAEALQGLSRIGQAHIETRRTIVLAFFYPLLVLSLAYVLFLVGIVELLPRFVAAADSLRIEPSRLITVGEQLRRTVTIWGPIPPLLLGVALVGWRWVGRARSLNGAGRLGVWVDRLPVIGRLVGSDRAANFADLLAHLVDHDVPLDQAVQLAGDAAGSLTFQQAATRFAVELTAGGRNVAGPAQPMTGFPPLVAWMLTANSRQAELTQGLRHLATAYRRQANRQAANLRVILPVVLLLLIGATTVLAYGVFLFVPLRSLWDGLAISRN